jgi:hypothetical protein
VVDPAATTSDVEDVNGGPPGGDGSKVRQWPPLMLETSMTAPLGGPSGRSGSGHLQS